MRLLDLCTSRLSLGLPYMKINLTHMISRILLFALAMLAAVACSANVLENKSPVATPTGGVLNSPTSGVLNSPLPSPITVIPTPSRPDRMTITGILLRDANAPRPVAGALLYLANLLPDASGKPVLASFDKVSSPRTQTDAAGRFVFADVPASTYSLVLDVIADSYLLKDPATGGDLLFQPKAGQVLDVGKLVYSSLPSDSAAP